MPLPTAGLTFHADASVVDDLWTVNTAGVFSVHAVDTGSVNYWDDFEHTDIVAKSTIPPTWRSLSTGLMAKPCLDFDGTNDQYNLYANNGTTAKTLADLITTTTFTLLLSIYIDDSAHNDATNPYNNGAVISDLSGVFSINIRKPSGYKLQLYVWDGAVKFVELDVSVNTRYTILAQFGGGTLTLAIVNGASTSLGSVGAITTLVGGIAMGVNYSGGAYYNGRLGEIAIWNTTLSGQSLTDAVDYFRYRWQGRFLVDTTNALMQYLTANYRFEEPSTGVRRATIGPDNWANVGSVTGTAGKRGNASLFASASAQYLTHPADLLLKLGPMDWTFAFLVRIDSAALPAGAQTILGMWGNGTVGGGLSVQFDYRGPFCITCYETGGASIQKQATTFGTPALGTWNLVVVRHTLSTKTIKISVNGVSDSITYTNTLAFSTSATWTIGRLDAVNLRYLDGAVDEMWMWNKVISAQEETDLINAGMFNAIVYELPPITPKSYLSYQAVKRASVY